MLYNGPELLSSASDKTKLQKTFLRTRILMTIRYLCLFSLQGLNLNCRIFMLTPKLVKKVITNLDMSKVSGPSSIPVVVLKKCMPELS